MDRLLVFFDVEFQIEATIELIEDLISRRLRAIL
jgi:hypothetical protein